MIEEQHAADMRRWAAMDARREQDMTGIRAKAAAALLAARHGSIHPEPLNSRQNPLCDALGGVPVGP